MSAREENRKLNQQEYDSGAVRLRSMPQYLAVELTQGCNLACPMCRPKIISAASRSMSEGVFCEAEKLFSTAALVDLRGWGESLMMADVEDKVCRVARSGADIRFVTNLAFRRDISDLLAEHRCYVAVSVDTVDQLLYPILRGGADFVRMRRNLENLTAAYLRRWGTTERLHLTTTIMKASFDGLENLVSFAAAVGIREIRLFSVSAPSSSALALCGQNASVELALQKAATSARASGVTLIAGTRLGNMPEKAAGGPACLHPWSYAVIGYDGSVGFCDHLIGPDGEPYLVGDLTTSTFEDIWNGEAWVALRREHLADRSPNAPRFEECAWCYVNRHVDFEDLFHKSFSVDRQFVIPKGMSGA